MSISDNNMGGESHSVRIPELSGPLHQPTPTSTPSIKRALTDSKAETYPTWSTGSQSTASSNDQTRHIDSLNITTTSKDLSSTSTPSSSRSRSRSKGAYDTHRASQDGGSPWVDDKEAKHKKFLGKVMEHKLAPSFLE